MSVREFVTGLLLALAVAGCGSMPRDEGPADASDAAAETYAARQQLAEARRWQQVALGANGTRGEVDDWLNCAASAYKGLRLERPEGPQAAELATACARRFLQLALSSQARRWSTGHTRVQSATFEIELRGLSPNLVGRMQLTRARDVSMGVFGGRRYTQPGFGVPIVIRTPRCEDAPACDLLPPEGVYRNATAWIEPSRDAKQQVPRLVIADPFAAAALVAGNQSYTFAADTSAAYALGASTSSLRRLSIYGLIGGDAIDRRAGLYMLEDYDPRKRPIVMIHGLGANPLNWARLSNAILGDPELRSRYQVWHIVYRTDAPVLIVRARVHSYLDQAWKALDPEGDDPARIGIVLVGHSMGGVVARMLCVEPGDALWDAAFAVPHQQLPVNAADAARIDSVFHFHAYPGVTRAIFLAAPHHGSPAADAWWARMIRTFVGHRAEEAQVLWHLANEHPEVLKEGVRETYREAQLNSIYTLRVAQPVRLASQSMLPVAGIEYHTIAASLQGENPPGDGFVPIDSAMLPGAASMLIVEGDHKLYENDVAIAEVLRILREDRAPVGPR